MMNYFVKMTPLEPYAFGTDQNFKYAGVEGTGKETYFVPSRNMPEQTTILGMLRYLILKNEGILRSDFQYTEEERAKMKECIGPESFSFAASEKQDFGYIKKISPVFLTDGQENHYIRNPFHNSSETGFRAMELEETPFETSAGEIRLPGKAEYNAKTGHGEGFYNLEEGTVKKNLFHTMLLTGNRKNGREDSGEDSFFKREAVRLESGFSFAVYVDATRLPGRDICYMGQKKSAFLVTAKEVEGNLLASRVEQAFAKEAQVWEYALSDLVVSGELRYDTFCIVEEKSIRNLETNHREKNYIRKIKKSKNQYNLIQSGSVFFKRCPLKLDNENCRQIGYNQIVRLGGR